MAIKRRYQSERTSSSRPSPSVSVRSGGQRITSHAKQPPKGYIGRKSELIRLARSVLIDNVPVGFRRRPDLFRAALPKLQQLSYSGGEEYQKAVRAFRFAYVPLNPEDFNSKGRGSRLVETVRKRPDGEYDAVIYKAHIWYDERPYNELLSHLTAA